MGVNVFLVLVSGIFLSGIIGLSDGTFTVISFAQHIWTGFTSMNEAFFLALFCGGISEMITYYGGIAWLIEKLQKISAPPTPPSWALRCWCPWWTAPPPITP